MKLSIRLICIFLLIHSSSLAAPGTISFQGKLLESGQPVDTGEQTLSMAFRVYDGGDPDVSSDDRLLYEERQSVAVTNGIYSVLLGSAAAEVDPQNRYDNLTILIADYSIDDLLLEVGVDGDDLTPRLPFTSSPFSMNTDTLDGFDSKDFALDNHDHAAQYVDVAGDTMTGTLSLPNITDSDNRAYSIDPSSVTNLNETRSNISRASSLCIGSLSGGDCRTAWPTGDNLGNHTATQNISLGNYFLSGDGGAEGIRISSTGEVGIGKPSVDFNQKFGVYSSDNIYAGYFESDTSSAISYGIHSKADGAGGTDHFGVWGSAKGATKNYGLYGKAYGANSSDENFGVYGKATGNGYNVGVTGSATSANTGINYGVIGKALGGSQNYAGYFFGDLYSTGNIAGVEVVADTFRYKTPKAHELTLGKHDFHTISGSATIMYNPGISFETGTGSHVVYAPVHFPVNATITKISIVKDDSDPIRSFRIYLAKDNLISQNVFDFYVAMFTNYLDDYYVPDPPVVIEQGQPYYIRVETAKEISVGVFSPGPSDWGESMKLRAITIEYTVPEA